MKDHAGTILLIAIIVGCLGWLSQLGNKAMPRRTTASVPMTKPALSEERIEKATQYFCAVKYRRESCITYLVKCGEKCFGYLTDENKVRIFADYQDLRVKNHLKRLPETFP